MSSASRTSQFARIHKILKKYYKPVVPDSGRSVLEHLLFACCLEDAHYEAAEEAYAALVHTFFDWNEVRVTTIAELSEVVTGLPDPRIASNRVKRVLQGVFEATYSFDLEELRKKNLGPTVKWLEKIDGTSTFTISYVVQAALSGHSIPIGAGELQVLGIADVITEKDIEAQQVPGLERAIAKSRGVEFGSLLHQFGADFAANPFAPQVRDILLEINPDCKDRLPKRRGSRKDVKKPEEGAEAVEGGASPAETKGHTPAAEKEKKRPAEPSAPGAEKKKAEDQPPTLAEKKKKAEDQAAAPAPAEKPAKKEPASVEKPPAETTPPTAGAPKKKPVSEGLAKRKPR